MALWVNTIVIYINEVSNGLFFLLSRVDGKLLLPQFSNPISFQMEKDQNPDLFLVLLSSWLDVGGFPGNLVCIQEKIQGNNIAFWVMGFLQCKSKPSGGSIGWNLHRYFTIYKLCLFFYFKTGDLLLFLSVRGIEYLSSWQSHDVCQ